jgi:hypothetical protein
MFYSSHALLYSLDFLATYEGVSRYFEGTLAQYISERTLWIYLKFEGLIEYSSKFWCAKNCGDTLQDAGVSTAFVKISPKMGQNVNKRFSAT